MTMFMKGRLSAAPVGPEEGDSIPMALPEVLMPAQLNSTCAGAVTNLCMMRARVITTGMCLLEMRSAHMRTTGAAHRSVISDFSKR